MTEKARLEIKNLYVSVEDEEILKGVDLTINEGEVHALMGPNGSGKSTLAYAVVGHPKYEVTGGEVLLNGENVLEMEADERSKAGLFLAFQYPVAIPGITVANFLRMAINTHREEKGLDNISPIEFRKMLIEKMELLEIDKSFAGRYLNEGFSGGEKKRAEALQMAVMEPKIAIMDETDSGLDIDALQVVSDGVNTIQEQLGMGVLVITHYQRILNYIEPDHVHVMLDGRIVASGGPELAVQLEGEGYDWVREELAKEAV